MSLSKVRPAPTPVLLFGPLVKKGISLHRYCYRMAHPSFINAHFQQESLLLLFNVSGQGHFSYHSQERCLHHLPITPQKVILQMNQGVSLVVEREADQEHRFFILEITRDRLDSLLREYPHGTKKEIHAFLQGTLKKANTTITPFCSHLRLLCEELLLTHSRADRSSFGFYAKILTLLSHTLLESQENRCCHRKDHVALQRIKAVKKLLMGDLTQTPSLAECASAAHCSEAYLSRTFSQYTGMTMSRYLRNLRLEKAAELLRTGRYNVTEAAMAVGYSSVSHFSKIFAEMFETCPCAFTSSPSKLSRAPANLLDQQGKGLQS